MGVPYSVILVSSILTLGTCAQNTSASITGCRPQCEIAVSALTWNWRSASITSSIVYATVLYITDDVDGTVRTSTLLNELPSGITVPSLNQAGTHVEQATVETAKGRFTTIELYVPFVGNRWNSANSFECVSDSINSSRARIYMGGNCPDI
jgi:hypothetical protein